MSNPMNALGHVFFTLLNEKKAQDTNPFGLSPIQFGHRMTELLHGGLSLNMRMAWQRKYEEWAKLNEHVGKDELLKAFRQRFIRTTIPLL